MKTFSKGESLTASSLNQAFREVNNDSNTQFGVAPRLPVVMGSVTQSGFLQASNYSTYPTYQTLVSAGRIADVIHLDSDLPILHQPNKLLWAVVSFGTTNWELTRTDLTYADNTLAGQISFITTDKGTKPELGWLIAFRKLDGTLIPLNNRNARVVVRTPVWYQPKESSDVYFYKTYSTLTFPSESTYINSYGYLQGDAYFNMNQATLQTQDTITQITIPSWKTYAYLPLNGYGTTKLEIGEIAMNGKLYAEPTYSYIDGEGFYLVENANINGNVSMNGIATTSSDFEMKFDGSGKVGFKIPQYDVKVNMSPFEAYFNFTKFYFDIDNGYLDLDEGKIGITGGYMNTTSYGGSDGGSGGSDGGSGGSDGQDGYTTFGSGYINTNGDYLRIGTESYLNGVNGFIYSVFSFSQNYSYIQTQIQETTLPPQDITFEDVKLTMESVSGNLSFDSPLSGSASIYSNGIKASQYLYLDEQDLYAYLNAVSWNNNEGFYLDATFSNYLNVAQNQLQIAIPIITLTLPQKDKAFEGYFYTSTNGQIYFQKNGGTTGIYLDIPYGLQNVGSIAGSVQVVAD